MKKIFIILGADNVGKTTIINRSFHTITEYMPKIKAYYKHFSAPKVGEHPLKQYRDYIEYLQNNNYGLNSLIYMDRAWPESKFYEGYRRNNNEISFNDCFELESEFLDFAVGQGYSVAFYLIYKPWSLIEKYHVDELLNKADFAKESAALNNESLVLTERENEHKVYYKFMSDYMSQRVKECEIMTNSFPFNVISTYNLDFSLV